LLRAGEVAFAFASRRFGTADLLKAQTPIFPMPSFAQRDATAQRGSCPHMPNALANTANRWRSKAPRRENKTSRFVGMTAKNLSEQKRG